MFNFSEEVEHLLRAVTVYNMVYNRRPKMPDFVRKQVYLERRQVNALQSKAHALGVSESELIRSAIDKDMYGSGEEMTRPDPAAWEEIEAFLAAQPAQPQSGAPYQFNRDELYDERLGRIDAADPD
jgi:hypothetical protein